MSESCFYDEEEPYHCEGCGGALVGDLMEGEPCPNCKEPFKIQEVAIVKCEQCKKEFPADCAWEIGAAPGKVFCCIKCTEDFTGKYEFLEANGLSMRLITVDIG